MHVCGMYARVVRVSWPMDRSMLTSSFILTPNSAPPVGFRVRV